MTAGWNKSRSSADLSFDGRPAGRNLIVRFEVNGRVVAGRFAMAVMKSEISVGMEATSQQFDKQVMSFLGVNIYLGTGKIFGSS